MVLRTIGKKYILVLTIFIIVIAGFILKDPIYNQLAKWSILQKSENVTELYFTNPSLVPSSYTLAQPIVTTVTVRNNTNTTKNYQYTISELSEAGDARVELQAGRLVVPPQGQKDARLQFIPVDLGVSVMFDIQLADQAPRINFWATKL